MKVSLGTTKDDAVVSARMYVSCAAANETSILPNCRNGWPARTESRRGRAFTASFFCSSPLRNLDFVKGRAMPKKAQPTFVGVLATLGVGAFAAALTAAQEPLACIPR